MDKSNIVLFPVLKMDTPPQTLEEVSEKIRQHRQSFADEISEELTNFVLNEIVQAGYNFDSDDSSQVASVQLINESVRSLIMELTGLEHPLQQVSDDMYIPKDQKLVDNECLVE